MKVVVYWENPEERAKAVGIVSPLQRWLRTCAAWGSAALDFPRVTVTARPLADAVAEEAAKFAQDVENAFGVPKPKRRNRAGRDVRAFGGELVRVVSEDE